MQLEQHVEQTQVRSTRGSQLTDSIMRIVCLICAILLVAVIVGVFLLLGLNAFKVFGEGATVGGYLLGTNWNPTGCGGSCNPSFGAGGLILGSVITTLIAVPHCHTALLRHGPLLYGTLSTLVSTITATTYRDFHRNALCGDWFSGTDCTGSISHTSDRSA